METRDEYIKKAKQMIDELKRDTGGNEVLATMLYNIAGEILQIKDRLIKLEHKLGGDEGDDKEETRKD